MEHCIFFHFGQHNEPQNENFMTNGAFPWNFTKIAFWTLQVINNKDGMKYFWSIMLVENTDTKFIHKFNLLFQKFTKTLFSCHRICPGFGVSTVVRSTNFKEFPLKITWKSSTVGIEKIYPLEYCTCSQFGQVHDLKNEILCKMCLFHD